MNKAINIFKGLGYAYILTLIAMLIYNLLLTFTSISTDNMDFVASAIIVFCSAFGGFYACRKIKSKGLLYGLVAGVLYIAFLVVFFFLARESFVFDKGLVYNVVFTTLAGGIGGVIGVNF